MFYTYIIRCKDNTLYTGYTTDIERRMKEHNAKGYIEDLYLNIQKQKDLIN